MTKPISFRDIPVEAPWEIERMVYEQELRDAAHDEESAGLKEDYLERGIDTAGAAEEDGLSDTAVRATKKRRFGEGSAAEGPDFVHYVT
jgi:hypothetical protein